MLISSWVAGAVCQRHVYWYSGWTILGGNATSTNLIFKTACKLVGNIGSLGPFHWSIACKLVGYIGTSCCCVIEVLSTCFTSSHPMDWNEKQRAAWLLRAWISRWCAHSEVNLVLNTIPVWSIQDRSTAWGWFSSSFFFFFWTAS
jgi:hypothetical protein